jgi:prepilin-type N-terminal cleavage/methylation domain-containing protein
MKLAHPRRTGQPGRSGFTLIELLIVIAIIGILTGLITSAVMKLRAKGPIVVTKTEIGQLESSVSSFHNEFKLSKEYFPSRFIICERYQDYLTGIANGGFLSQVYQDSLNFLQRMFPRLWRTPATQASPAYDQDWNNNGKLDAAILLEGDQCLVFFLGGIPTPPNQTPGCLGFSTNGARPAQLGGSSRKGPYFEFQSSRLVRIHGNGAGNRYFSYLDPHGRGDGNGNVVNGMPYAYFSSYRTANGYNPYYTLISKSNPGNTAGPSGLADYSSDCSLLGVWPYAQALPGASASFPNGNYMYPTKFQIISAGADQTFAPGTDLSSANPQVWTPANATVFGQTGKDDQANFASELLGVPQ